jgi:hypothetical protein
MNYWDKLWENVRRSYKLVNFQTFKLQILKKCDEYVIERKIKDCVEALNKMPYIVTTNSCGGHTEKRVTYRDGDKIHISDEIPLFPYIWGVICKKYLYDFLDIVIEGHIHWELANIDSCKLIHDVKTEGLYGVFFRLRVPSYYELKEARRMFKKIGDFIEFYTLWEHVRS